MSSSLVGVIGRRKSSSLIGLAVGLVLLVGGSAMALNLGLLEGSMRLQTLEFESVRAPSSASEIVDTVVLTALKPQAPSSNRFAIAGTAVVELRRIEAGVTLSSVEAEPGWAWSATDESSGNVAIEFESEEDTMTFSAAVDNAGSVVAQVQSLHHGRSQTTVSPSAATDGQPQAGDGSASNPKSTSSDDAGSTASAGGGSSDYGVAGTDDGERWVGTGNGGEASNADSDDNDDNQESDQRGNRGNRDERVDNDGRFDDD